MQKERKWLLLGSLLFLWITPVWAGSMDLSGFVVDVGEGELPPKPQPTQEPESPPKPTQKPESPPKPTQKPESLPKPTQKPENPPKPTQEPESPPKPTQKSENPPKPTQKPESTSKPMQKPKSTSKPAQKSSTQKPESPPKPTPKPESTPKPTSKTTQIPQNTPDLKQSPVSVDGQNQGLERNQGTSTTESPRKGSTAPEGEKDENYSKKAEDWQEPLTVSKTGRALSHSQKTVQKAGFVPRILVQSPHEVYVLSYRINGKEVFWHWEEDWLIPENPHINEGSNNVQLLLLEDGKNLWKMKEWQFFVKSL